MDAVILAIKALLTSALGTGYTYFYGENKVAAEAELPCVEVVPVRTSFEVAGTGGCARNSYEVQINVKNSIKKFVKDTPSTTVEHLQALVKAMEERDPTTGQPLASTVLGVIRANLKLSNTVNIVNVPAIDYNVSEYNGSWIAEASMRLECKQITPKN